ncbi:Stf0 family sulfotransferase [Oceanicella sp. SM1341]|uniref:Stf0 family sulfotransferase n=1 Tax=Oceanicella sp. SM1341 TaxID=1548889 RepID=UPI000E552661|nr:Stf0 family sulfotransferase [Oceanicella sp. SM1341]
MRSCIICTSPRSGSTLLCRLLQATGRAGLPDSHFHEPSLAAWAEDYGLAPESFPDDRALTAAVLKAAIARGSGDTGCFGLRLQQHSFGFFMERLGALFPQAGSDAERLRAAFGETLFIHLTREDKLAQAVSRLKAEQTGLWHRRADGSELERLSAPRPPAYDAAAIAAHVADMTAADAAWEAWFAAQGITPLRLTYDALSRAPQAVLAQVLGALGLDPALAEGVAAPTARLSDALSAEWIARFRAEGAGSPV